VKPTQSDGNVTARTIVFVVGAPRSGTTYLQNLLGSQPQVVTSQETDLFARYVATWRSVWNGQLPAREADWLASRHKGLPAVLTQTEFEALLKHAVERVYRATFELKPSATVLVDKTPQNARFGEEILRLLPDARFVHILRDGRDVVASLQRAARGWGRDWAPSKAASAAALWRHDVEAGRAIAHQTDAYLEIRYEELVSERGADALRDVLAFCGVDITTAESEQAMVRFRLSSTEIRSSLVWGGEVVRRLGGAPADPPGFAGEGGVGAWMRDLDTRARIALEQEAGALLHELGYTPSPDWIGGSGLERRAAELALALASAVDRRRNHLAGILRT
jgi:hypothetical protein